MAKYTSWDPEIDLNDLLSEYISIEEKQQTNPITLELPEPPDKEPGIGGEEKQRFFTPSLQHQRNAMVYELLKYGDGNMHKVAMLGCGELSFEKYALKDLWDRGVKHIVSVDIDEQALSNGLRNMKGYIDHHQEYTMKRTIYPAHIEIYKGDILTPSPVLSNVGIAISTEVIEHMPLEKATELLKCVLEKIRPTIYILSTPNYEYNVVFNRDVKFRHDDHHFEFTRDEFKNWLNENVPPCYNWEIILVGKLEGHEDLGGATQFALIMHKDYDNTKEAYKQGCEITENEGAYQKVGDFVYRGSYFRLFEAVVVGAFKRFLDQFPFDHDQLTTIGTLKFWRISIESILEFRTRPTIEINEDDGMLMLTRLFSTLCYNSQMPDSKRAALSIPVSITKRDLLAAVSKLFACFT